MDADKNQIISGILILAAGTGSRYRLSGGKGDKLMALYPDESGAWVPLIELTLRNATGSGLPVVLMCRPENYLVQKIAEAYQVRTVLLSSKGSGETIAAGVTATADWNAWIITPGDMGWILPQDYILVDHVLQRGTSQVRLMWGSQPGHPVGFSDKYRDELCSLNDDCGAKKILNHEVFFIQAPFRVVKDADYSSHS